MRPLAALPRPPVRTGAFGLLAAQPAQWTLRRWRGQAARALFAGVAAHALSPLTSRAAPPSASCSPPPRTVMAGPSPAGVRGHRRGARRPSRRTRRHHRNGRPCVPCGTFPRPHGLARPGSPRGGEGVRSASSRPRPARVHPLPARARRVQGRPGGGGGVPWRAEVCRTAGTVHLRRNRGGDRGGRTAVFRGRMPRRPFVLVAEQYLADPGRSAGDIHPVWAYAHVPHGYDGDATATVLERIEQYARTARPRHRPDRPLPAALEAYNPNYVGGDILNGANSPASLAFRPRLAPDPYATGIPGVYLCSAATPPGAGVTRHVRAQRREIGATETRTDRGRLSCLAAEPIVGTRARRTPGLPDHPSFHRSSRSEPVTSAGARGSFTGLTGSSVPLAFPTAVCQQRPDLLNRGRGRPRHGAISAPTHHPCDAKRPSALGVGPAGHCACPVQAAALRLAARADLRDQSVQNGEQYPADGRPR